MSKNTEKAKRNSFFNLYFTSTVSIALALFMIGLMVLLLLWGRYAANTSKENLVITLVLNDSTTQEDIVRVENYLNVADFVKKQHYISKDDALKEHIADLGDNPEEFLGYNPLKASFEVNLKADYANDDSLKNVEKKFVDYKFIQDIVYQRNMIEDLNRNVKKISIVLALISTLLLIITVMLINNTIRISIYSKRFIINTMKLVGAKAGFIRKPFLKRFIYDGLIASFIAALGLFGVGYYLKNFDNSLPLYDYRFFLPILIVVFGLGFLVSFFAVLFGINRYIRMKSNDLYFI